MVCLVLPTLLGLVAVSFAQHKCSFKEGAEDLVSVGYWTDEDGSTAVDRIQVKMKDRKGKYVDLIEGCEKTKNKVINVLFRVQGDTEWKKGRRTKLSGRRATLYLEHLNPCDVYEVTLSVDEEQLPIFNVGPYYNGDYEHVYLYQEQDNEVYESYSVNPFNHIEIVGEEDSAKIIVSGFCARIIELEVQDEAKVDEPHLLTLHNDLKNTTKLEGLLPNLKPCTKYQITVDLYLNEDNDEDSMDYMRQNFAAFHTMPTKKSLDRPYYNPENKTLIWDFNEFFNQDCASPKPTEIQNFKVTLVSPSMRVTLGLAGSIELISDCDSEFRLEVEYSKLGEVGTRKITVFNQNSTWKPLKAFFCTC